MKNGLTKIAMIVVALSLNVAQASEALVNVVNLHECLNGSAATSILGTWRSEQRQGEFQFTLDLTVFNNSIRMTNTCSVQGRQLTASVTASSHFDSSSLTVTSSAYDVKRIQEPGFSMECDAAAQPFRLNYHLQGSCLIMQADSEPQPMIWKRVQ